jgi:hypothetical protein
VTKDQQIRLLTRALLFYAKGQHYSGFDTWDAPDEPNWLCPPTEGHELLEDGGVAAAALRKVYGRALTRYENHNSLGHSASKVCPDHQFMQPCPRCGLRLKRIAELMRLDPAPDSNEGRSLMRLVALQEAAEKNLMPSQVTVSDNDDR